MKPSRFLVPFLVAGLSACSSMQANVASTDDPVDSAKVAAVERAARANGVSVYWMHYPQLHAAAEKQVQ